MEIITSAETAMFLSMVSGLVLCVAIVLLLPDRREELLRQVATAICFGVAWFTALLVLQ